MIEKIMTLCMLASISFALDSDLQSHATTVKTSTDQKMSSCVLLFDKDGWILGSARKNNADLFGLPGGKLELNDDFYAAAVRETLEETGVTLAKNTLAPVFRAFDGPFDVLTFMVSGTVENRPTLKPGTGEGVCRWITPKELVTGAFPVYNAALLKSLPDNLKKFYQDQGWYKELCATK